MCLRLYVYVTCNCPSVVWMIAGYENSPGWSSNVATVFHVLPSSVERANNRGVRADLVGLYTRYQSLLAARTASMPLLGFDNSVGLASVQVSPPSVDSERQMKPMLRARHRATIVFLSAVSRSVG